MHHYVLDTVNVLGLSEIAKSIQRKSKNPVLLSDFSDFLNFDIFHVGLLWFFKGGKRTNGLSRIWRGILNKIIGQSHWLLSKHLGKFYDFYRWSDFSRRSWRHGSCSNTALLKILLSYFFIGHHVALDRKPSAHLVDMPPPPPPHGVPHPTSPMYHTPEITRSRSRSLPRTPPNGGNTN